MGKVQGFERFEGGNGGGEGAREGVRSEGQGLEVGEGRNGRRNRTKEEVVGEVEDGELGEMGDERCERAGVASRVENELRDSCRVGVAGEAADELGAARDGTWIGGEVPGG